MSSTTLPAPSRNWSRSLARASSDETTDSPGNSAIRVYAAIRSNMDRDVDPVKVEAVITSLL